MNLTGILAQPITEISGATQPSILLIIVSAAITENILLTRFLGMCPFLSISRELKSAVGMGLAVIVVTAGTTFLNALLYRYVLLPLEPFGVPADSMALILFIVIIAAFVQLLEMLLERVSVTLYFALGIFLPLITVNCAILGASLFMLTKNFFMYPWRALLYGFGCGLGWFLAIILMAGIRVRLAKSPIPAGLEGPGITLIVAGIMAMAFTVFAGMIKT